MKISTKGTYGLKAIVDLAVNCDNDTVILKDICARQNISESYLEQIFAALRKSGLIKGRKGSKGGYKLSKDMSEITVGDILRALEGDLSIVSLDDVNEKDIMEKCLNDNVWHKLNSSINTIVNSITLEDLANEYKKQDEKHIMYFI